MSKIKIHKKLPQEKTEGLYDISMPEYLALDAMSKSKLLNLYDGTPRHLQADLRGEIPQKEASYFDFGSAMHLLLFEPDRFPEEVAIFDKLAPENLKKDGSPLAKAKGSKAWEMFEAENIGKMIFESSEIETLLKMANIARANPAAKAILDFEGYREITGLYQFFGGPDNPIKPWIKGRFDLISPGARIVIDYKTFGRRLSKRSFGQQVATLAYHWQAAMYLDMAARFYGEDASRPWRFVFFAQEKSPPYIFRPYWADSVMIEAGRAHYRTAVARWCECEERFGSDPWPDWPMTERPPKNPAEPDELALPDWALSFEIGGNVDV